MGTCTRYAHFLSKALLLDPNRQNEGEEARQEAQRLRKLLPSGRADLGDESDAAYEMLVNIIQR
jgi:hypothetical protein